MVTPATPTADARARLIDDMIRWKQAFDELVPRPGPAERALLRDRLARFSTDLLATAVDDNGIDIAAIDDLITEIERICSC